MIRIYRNLHRNALSIQTKIAGKGWRVTDHVPLSTTIDLFGVDWKVYESGRKRVLKTKQKNVHAFIVADRYEIAESRTGGRAIGYNPYKYQTFVTLDDGLPAPPLERAYMRDGVVFKLDQLDF